MEFSRNFPLDELTEAQTAQARIAAGLPKEWVYSRMSDVDDVDYIMEMIEREKESAMSMFEAAQNMAKAGGFDSNEDDGLDQKKEEQQ